MTSVGQASLDPPRDGVALSATDGALGLATSRYMEDRVASRVDAAIDDIRTGAVTVPSAPTGEVIAPPDVDVTDVATVTWDGEVCAADALPGVASGALARVEFVNSASQPHDFVVEHDVVGVEIATVTRPGARTLGFAIVGASGTLKLSCSLVARDGRSVDGALTAATVGLRPP